MPWIDLRVLEEDFPSITGVDLKLIELARQTGCKIVTNDFNLNKLPAFRASPSSTSMSWPMP
jgi:uncharacterized protein YacL